MEEKVTDPLRLPVKQIFQPINTMMMTIAATRMYRSLMYHGTPEIELQGILPRCFFYQADCGF